MPRLAPSTEHGPPGNSPVTTGEWGTIAALLCAAVLVRVWFPERLAVEHFDEGVYASNRFTPLTDYRYPFQHLYAPPLIPTSLEWCLLLGGGAPESVMLFNLAVGAVTVPSVWWVARSWFGSWAGLLAAWLAAFSEVHVQFTRTALTDPLLCLSLLWGVHFGREMLSTGRLPALLLAVGCATLAWWTKYNGWLTLAIVTAGALPWLAERGLHHLAHRRRGPAVSSSPPESEPGSVGDAPSGGRLVLLMLALVALTLLGWLPVLRGLQPSGGYTAVAANHAGYFVGWSGWFASANRQWASLGHLESSITWLSLAFAAIGWWAGGRPAPRRGGLWAALMASTPVVLAAIVGVTTTLLLASLTAVGVFLVGRWRGPAGPSDSRGTVAGWLLSAWLVGLLVAVPLYYPYPRLALPLVVASWLGSSWAATGLLGHRPALPAIETARPSAWFCASLLMMLVVTLLLAGDAPAWQDRSGLAHVATEMWRTERSRWLPEPVDAAPGEPTAVLYVVGQPALFFQLAARQDARNRSVLVLPAGGFRAVAADRPPAVPTYFVSPLEFADATLSDPEWADRLERLCTFAWRPSDLVWLDDVPADAIAKDGLRRVRQVAVFGLAAQPAAIHSAEVALPLGRD